MGTFGFYSGVHLGRYRTARVVLTLFLAGFGLLLLMLFLEDPVAVRATPPIEGNPISMGGGVEVVTASVGVRTVAAADMDRDGRIDLALADGSQVRIVGNAYVTAPVWSLSATVGLMGTPVVDLAVADLDRDGRMDLAVAATDSAGDSQLVLWQNPITAVGSFTTAWMISTTLTGTAHITLTTLAVGDLDQDGALDVVAAGRDGLIRLWHNPLAGTQAFTTAWDSPTVVGRPGEEVSQVALVDSDRNGWLDIVAVMSGTSPVVRLWQNPLTGAQPFTTPWVVSNTLGSLGSGGLSVVVADFDSNGTPDIAVGDAAGALTAWSNPLTGMQAFTTSWTISVSVGHSSAPLGALAVGDFDLDGQPDLAGGTEGSPAEVLVWRNSGAPMGGNWPTSTVGTRPNPVYDLAVADFELDGDMDIVSGNGGADSGDVLLWPNVHLHRAAAFNRAGVVAGTVNRFGTGGGLTGDLDQDGHPDIVAGFAFMSAWRNSGDPFGSGWNTHSLGWASNAIPKVLADMDRDGDLDMITAKQDGPYTVRVWENDGTPFDRTWASYEIGSMPTGVQAVAVGDVDGNGTPDVVIGAGTGSVANTGPVNSVYVWRYEGTPFASTWISAPVGIVTYSVNALALSDLNGDARLDVVIGTHHAPPMGTSANPVPQEEWPDVYQLRAFRNDGMPFDGGWTEFDLGRDPVPHTQQVVYHGFWGASIYAVSTADFDNDGDMDVVTGEGIEGDFTIAVWENDGTPFDGGIWNLTAVGLGAGGYFLADRIYTVFPADFNSDGLVDLVSGSGSNEIYEVNYWENSGVPFGTVPTDTHWIRHGVEEHGRYAFSVQADDLDRDGDEDIVALTLAGDWSLPYDIYVFQNESGTVSEAVGVVTPLEMVEGSTRDLMQIVVSHHGKVVDHDVELAEWRLTFKDATGTPLTSAQADVLFASLTVYRDTNGDSVWQVGDTPVITISEPALISGVQSFSFVSGDELVAVSATQTITYFVVATMEITASEQSPFVFQVVFDPDEASVVKDRVNGASVSIIDTQPITITVDGGGPAFSLSPSSVEADTPYAIQVYTLTLTNNDVTTDTFDLTHVATDTSGLPAGPPAQYEWVVFMPTTVVTVPAGMSTTLPVTVEIPSQEVKWVTHTLTITATSRNHSAQALTSTVTTLTGGHWDVVDGRWEGCRFDFGNTGQVIFDDMFAVYDYVGYNEPRYDFGHTGQVIFDDMFSVYAEVGHNCEPPSP